MNTVIQSAPNVIQSASNVMLSASNVMLNASNVMLNASNVMLSPQCHPEPVEGWAYRDSRHRTNKHARIMSGDRSNAIVLHIENERSCRVCGLRGAFLEPLNFDVCPRCTWVDEPAAYAAPAMRSTCNDESLDEAIQSWPERHERQILAQPISTFAYEVDAAGAATIRMNGQPWRSSGSRGSMTYPLQADFDVRSAYRAELLGTAPSQNPSGRVSLIGCPLCGDIFCGAVTARIKRVDDRIVWLFVGYEYPNYDTGGWNLDIGLDPCGYSFDAARYEQALADIERYAEENKNITHA